MRRSLLQGRTTRWHAPLIPVIALALAGCGAGDGPEAAEADRRGIAPGEPGAVFVDATEYEGIDFVHTMGDDELSNIVETVGSGAAFLDFDGDGRLDLYVVNASHVEGINEGEPVRAGHGSRLYRNTGAGFVDVTDRAGVANRSGYGMGVAVGDYDNDGDPDLYVCNYGLNRLYRNDGDGTFTEVAERAGVAGSPGDNTVGAVWLDYDNDGLLDLYAGNYLEYDPEYGYYYAPDGFPPPMAYNGQPDRLYRNRGDGTFEDVTEAAGVFRPDGRMMGVAATDYDGDGWVDLYVSNDAMEDFLFHNEGGEAFTEVGFRAGVAFSIGGEETSSMAVDFGDYDGDGLLDLFVSDIHYSALYRNDGDGFFTDVTVAAGVAEPSGQYDGWGAAFVDYDNDGDLDIFKANGGMNHLYGHEDQLFENDGTGRYTDVSLERGRYFERELVGRGAAFGDYDSDGDIDVFVVNLHDRPVLLRNDAASGSWIQLLLQGTRSNRDGVGARVTVVANGRTQVAEKKSASGYLSTNDPRLHFGLGTADTVDRIEIRWPSGANQVLESVPAQQVLRVTEPADPVAGG
ncbi:MAG: CRTAC1 family protein [Longimicrobiales bacterium]|nr:CRTAC1 family protein [Longimicrobiales bacterium]